MKNILPDYNYLVGTKEKFLKEGFFILVIAAFLLIMPFALKTISLLIALMVGIATYHLLTKTRKFNSSNLLIGFVLFYLLHLIGVLFSSNRNEAWFDLEVKMSFFIFPFIIMVEWELIKKYKTQILLFFVISVLLVMLIDWTIAIFNYIEISDIKVFYYEKLSAFMHPSYFGMYINFSIIIIFTFVQNGLLKKKWIWGIVILGSLVFLYFLSSRTDIIVGFLLGLIMLIVDTKYFPSKWMKMVFILIFVFFVVFTKNERFRQLDSHSLFVKEINLNTISSVSTRVLLWDSALDIIKENFWFGVGTGDVKDRLSAQNLQNGYEKVSNIPFNTHNEYLEVFIKFGLLGFLIFAALLFIPFYLALRNKDLLGFGFMLITTLNFLTESMLNRQAGVLFFMFFYSILIIDNTTKIITKHTPNNL